MPTWRRFSYRHFYDVPRMIVVPLTDGRRILMDSKFDELVDEYDDHYSVYLLREDTALDGTWERIVEDTLGVVGRVRVAHVRFDPTRREEIDLNSLGLSELR